MIGRPQLAIGTAGQVRIYAQRDGYRAITTYRDFDGQTYRVQRHAKTKGAAQRALAEALRDRGRQVKNSTLTPESKVGVLAEMWWATIEASQRSPGTLRLYRDRLDRQVIPSLGSRRLRELTVGAVDRHLKAVTVTNGAAVAKAVRSALSGICTLACTDDALERNPVHGPVVHQVPAADLRGDRGDGEGPLSGGLVRWALSKITEMGCPTTTVPRSGGGSNDGKITPPE